MCGRASRPDVPAVDRAIGRRAGQEADKLLLTRHLLAQGLTIRTVLRLDYERLFREGSAYFRYYFRNIWSPEWEKLYAQNGIEQWIAAEKIKYHSLYSSGVHHDQHRYIVRQPQQADVVRFLREGWLVSLTVMDDVYALRNVLAYQWTEGMISLYYPEAQDSPLSTSRKWTINRLNAFWLPHEGIAGMRRSS